MIIRHILILPAMLMLTATFVRGSGVTITVDPSKTLKTVSPYLTGACLEDVNHEIYGGLYNQMIFGESFAEPADASHVSAMWRPLHRGDAAGEAQWITDQPFVGTHCQRISFDKGAGEFGIENRGLNRQGLSLLARHSYEGHFWTRAAAPANVRVSFASGDGDSRLSSADLPVTDASWHRYDFSLSPAANADVARFEIALTAPGSVDLGYVFLEPGPWGTYNHLPVRRDVAEAMIQQGITALRYGGSMANAPQYRWKNMIGPRDRRPVYSGHWYAYSTNGWGILDFLNFCEAAGLLAVPDFNIDETPQDMVDFLDYVNGPVTSPWGARRAADGHPTPYQLTHIELGNEQRVDQAYFEKFQAMARSIWTRDPHMILTVGDFNYRDKIVDPMHLTGADSNITDMSAHKQILALARQYDAEVWFDIHLWTDNLTGDGTVAAFPTYVDAIDKLADGAKHHVVVFELNANNHSQLRALANAQALMQIEQDGRLPFVASANCLQVDGQNDNGWDQGLLFLNSKQVWLQPPGYVLQMISKSHLPNLIACTMDGSNGSFSATALASDDRHAITLQALNSGDKPMTAAIHFSHWNAAAMRITMQTLAADLSAINTARAPDAVHPIIQTSFSTTGSSDCTVSPHSFTIFQFTEKGSSN